MFHQKIYLNHKQKRDKFLVGSEQQHINATAEPLNSADATTWPSIVEGVDMDDVKKNPLPSENLPGENLPNENLPSENLPSENLPSENLPSENLPSENLPSENLPSENLPSENLSDSFATVPSGRAQQDMGYAVTEQQNEIVGQDEIVSQDPSAIVAAPLQSTDIDISTKKYSFLSDNLLQKWIYFCKESPDHQLNTITGEDDEVTDTASVALDRVAAVANESEPKNIYEIRLCMYALNESCRDDNDQIMPFLQFLMKTDISVDDGQSLYTFASFDYECLENGTGEDSEDSEDSPTNVQFLNQCYSQMLDILKADSLIHEQNIQLADLYKGMVEHENAIYVVFDCSQFIKMPIQIPSLRNSVNSLATAELPSPEISQNHVWAVIDELLYKRSIMGIPVDDSIVDFFKQNQYMTYIHWEDKPILETFATVSVSVTSSSDATTTLRPLDKYDFPFQLYMHHRGQGMEISGDDSHCFACFAAKSLNSVDTAPHCRRSLVESLPKMDHPTFGPAYYFSNKINDMPRYVVFIKNPMYILKNISELDESTIHENKDKFIAASCIYFHENNMEINQRSVAAPTETSSRPLVELLRLPPTEFSPSPTTSSLSWHVVPAKLFAKGEQPVRSKPIPEISREEVEGDSNGGLFSDPEPLQNTSIPLRLPSPEISQLWCIKSNNHFCII